MLLKGNSFIAEFNMELNNFVSLQNTISGDDYIKVKPMVPLLSMIGLRKEDNERVDLMPGIADIDGDENRLVINYHKFLDYNIEAELIIEACDDKMKVSGKVSNKESELDIIEILCPHISGIYLGEDYKDDTVIYPHHAGERTRNPIDEYKSLKTKSFWRANSVLNGTVYAREINYCGLASMSWMYYYDNANGLYIGSHDPRFPVTGIIAECAAGQTPYMGFDFRKHHRIGYGDTYNFGRYEIVITDKDWHYGAEVYRSYIEKYLDFDHTPEFLKEEYALNQCYNFKQNGKIHNRFNNIPEMYEAGNKLGVKHMFIASWNRTGFDSFYPEYYPDMELGSAMEFRRGLEYIREHGGFSTLYINARIFDIKSDFHKLIGEKMAIRNHKDEMIYETYGPEHFTVNCPSDDLWKEYLLDTAEFTVKAYGADGIYLDQLASAEPFACHCKDHSHENIDEFNQGYLYVLKELLNRLKKDNPRAYIMTENCGDIYGSYTWGNLTWNGDYYDEYYNVFKYTFPEFIQINMVNPRATERVEPGRMMWFLKDMQRAILLGNILWLGITTHLKESNNDYHSYAKKALAFRKEIQEYIQEAKFLDHEYITNITNECDATVWKLKDGRYMILCGNYNDREEAKITLRLPDKVNELSKYNIDWVKEIIRIDNNEIDIQIDGSRLWCVVVE